MSESGADTDGGMASLMGGRLGDLKHEAHSTTALDKKPALVSQASGSDARTSARATTCVRCGGLRCTPSPLDPPGATERSWSNDHDAIFCLLCCQVAEIVENHPAFVKLELGGGVTSPITSTWPTLMQACVTLKLEKCDEAEITPEELLARYKVLAAAMSLAVTAERGPGFAASRGGQGWSHGHAAGASGSSQMLTPTKAEQRVSKSSPQSAKVATSSTATGSQPSVPTSASECSFPDGSPPAKAVAFPSHTTDDDSTEIVELSVHGSLRNGALGMSLGRIRKTINEYSDKIGAAGWYQGFKLPTVKALQRRLVNYDRQVKDALDIDLIKAYGNLKERVAGLIGMHQSLVKWKNTKLESHLMEFLKHLKPALQYLEYMGLGLCPELQVMQAHAEFAGRVDSAGSVSVAFKEIDHEALAKCFDEMNNPELHDEEEPQYGAKTEPVGDSNTDAVDAKAGVSECEEQSAGDAENDPKDSGLLVGSVLEEFLARVTDQSVQVRMHLIPPAVEQDASAVSGLASDLETLASEWKARFPKEDEVSGMKFSELLDAIDTVVRVTFPGQREAPVPSQVRDARQKIHKAAATKPAFRCAEAMACYKGCRLLMERARVVATSGLKDQASNDQFASIMRRIEGELEMAFESIDAWLTTGNGGEWQSLSSMENHMKLVQSIVAEVRMVCSQWSLAALELETDGLIDATSYMALILDTCSIVATKHFMNKFEGLSPVLLIAEKRVEVKTEDPDPGPPTEKKEPPQELEDALEQLMEEVVETEGAAAANERTLVGNMDGVGQNTSNELNGFLNAVTERLEEVVGLSAYISEKMGSKWSDAVAAGGIDLQMSLGLAQKNAELLTCCSKYISDVGWLISKAPEDPLAADEGNGYMQRLASFCRAHRSLNKALKGQDSLGVKADFYAMASKLGFGEFMQPFWTKFGVAVFQAHALPSTVAATTWLEEMCLRITPVDAAIIDDNPKLESLFGLVVQSESSEELAAWLEGITIDGDLSKVIEQWAHNTVLRNLTTCVSAIGLEELSVNSVRLVGNASSEQPTRQVVLYLQTSCMLRNIASLAAGLHHTVLLPVSRGKFVPAATLFEQAPCLMKAFGDCLVKLDAQLARKDAKKMEAEGWNLPVPLSVCQLWQRSMAAFRGRVLQTLLEQWASLLTSTTQQATNSCPNWEACFAEGVLKEKLAKSILMGKYSIVAKAHNKLYDMLGKMNTAGKVLDVSPRLQDHPLSSEAITIALHSLVKIKETCTIVEGVQILFTYQHSHLASQKADQFLKQQPAEIRRSKTVPAILWQELEGLTKDAPPPAQLSGMTEGGPRGTASNPGRHSPTVKEEVADDAEHGSAKHPPSTDGSEPREGPARHALKRRRMM